MMEKNWFKRKKFGWGWVPATWQGFAIVFIYVVAVILLVSTSLVSNIFYLSIILKILTLLLIFLTYWFGETPRWQWGQDDE